LTMPNRGMAIINGSDLYRIISHSHLPAAQEFEKWIMEKVIPSIRKTGSYTLPAAGKPMSHVENIARGLLSANFMIEQMKTEIGSRVIKYRTAMRVNMAIGLLK
jgi:prophage antirepressor-like protein